MEGAKALRFNPAKDGAPERVAVTFRFDDGSEEAPSFDAKLVELEAVWTPTGEGMESLRVLFDCDAAAYATIEENRWFGIEAGLAARLEVPFDPALPVRIEAAMDRLNLETGFWPLLAPGREAEALEELVAPLYEKDRFGAARSTVQYQYLRVSQERPGKAGLAFTPADAARAAGIPGEALVTSLSLGPVIPLLEAEPGTKACFAGPVNVAGKLLRIRAEAVLGPPDSVMIEVEFPYGDFESIVGGGLFAPDGVSIAPDLSAYDPGKPVTAKLALDPGLLELCFAKAGSDLESLLRDVVRALADPASVSMYCSVAVWKYRSFLG